MYFNGVSVSVSVYKWNVLCVCNLCRNTPFLCPDIVHKTKEDKLFINLSFKFVKTGQSLFSPPRKSVQWLTANFLVDRQGWGSERRRSITITTGLSNIEIVAVSDCYIMAVCFHSESSCRGNVSHHLGYSSQLQ